MKKIVSNTQKMFQGDSLQAKISAGIAWSFLGTFISKGLMLLTFIIVARVLTVPEYGQISILRNTIATLSAFSVMSFGVTATKYLAIYKNNDHIRAERILTFTRFFVIASSVIIATVMLIFSDYIAISILDDSSLSQYVKLSSITVFFTALNGYQNGLLAGLEKFKALSFINIFNGILTFPILIGLAYFLKIEGVVIGLALISFLTWSISAYYVHESMRDNSFKYQFKSCTKEFQTIKEFTLPSFLSGLSLAPAILVVNTIMAHQENGYYQLGIFNAAYFFSVITSTLNGVIGQVVYPYAMQQFKKDNKKFEYFNIISPWVIGIVLNLPLIIFPEILVMFFGAKYDTEDFKISVILVALFSIIIAHRQGIARNFAAANIMWWSVLSNGFWAFILIISASFLTSYGSIGLALSFFVAYIVNSIVFLPLYLHKNLVDKKLLFSYPTIVIWIVTLISFLIYPNINNIYFRTIILLSINAFIFYMFYKLWSVFTNNELEVNNVI